MKRLFGLVAVGMVCGCTILTPNLQTTPTPVEPAATDTPPPTVTDTPTLRPTVTNLPTATPVSGGIATPIPLSPAATGGGGYAFGSTGGGGTGSGSTGGGVAPVGERNTPTSGTGGGASGGGSIEVATLAPARTAAPTTTPSPLTPTAPPRYNEQYSYAVAANRTLVVQYDITLTRGTVILWAVSPSGEVVWQQAFTESVADEAEIAAAEGGEYDIFSYVEQFSGSYQVGYATR